MSAKGSFWAWEITGLKASQKLVLLCLGDCHNGDNGRCDPSVNFIHDKTGLNKKTIPGALTELEKLGLIRINKRPGTSTSYDLLFTENPISASSENGLPQKRVTPKTGTPESGEGVTPKTGDDLPQKRVTNLKGTCKEPKTDKYDFSAWPEKPSESAWDALEKLRKAKRAPITQFVVDRTAPEMQTVFDHGVSVDTAIAEWCGAGWTGFKAEWYFKRVGAPAPAPEKPKGRRSLAETYAEQENNRG